MLVKYYKLWCLMTQAIFPKPKSRQLFLKGMPKAFQIKFHNANKHWSNVTIMQLVQYMDNLRAVHDPKRHHNSNNSDNWSQHSCKNQRGDNHCFNLDDHHSSNPSSSTNNTYHHGQQRNCSNCNQCPCDCNNGLSPQAKCPIHGTHKWQQCL